MTEARGGRSIDPTLRAALAALAMGMVLAAATGADDEVPASPRPPATSGEAADAPTAPASTTAPAPVTATPTASAVSLGAAVVPGPVVSAVTESIDEPSLLAAVAHLASDDYYGRFYRSPFAFKAAEWIRARLEEAGLSPGAAGGAWTQPLADPEAGPNVIGMLPARPDSPHAERVLLISAHYDHLPPRRRGEDRIFNGADDNASGTCGIIAIAEALAALPTRPGRRILFVAFSGEEAGLLGAKRFVAEPPVPLESIDAVLNLDMISRGDPNRIFVDGRDFSEPIRAALRAANAAVGLEIRFDEHPDWLDRSDQGPFLRQGIPAVLFSVEDHEDYHQVTDHADRILPALAARTSRLVALAALLLAEQPPPARGPVSPPETPRDPKVAPGAPPAGEPPAAPTAPPPGSVAPRGARSPRRTSRVDPRTAFVPMSGVARSGRSRVHARSSSRSAMAEAAEDAVEESSG